MPRNPLLDDEYAYAMQDAGPQPQNVAGADVLGGLLSDVAQSKPAQAIGQSVGELVAAPGRVLQASPPDPSDEASVAWQMRAPTWGIEAGLGQSAAMGRSIPAAASALSKLAPFLAGNAAKLGGSLTHSDPQTQEEAKRLYRGQFGGLRVPTMFGP
jgi:hypothetical protein